MWVTTIRIDGQIYYLSENVDLPGLKDAFVEAVGAGAAFVDFETQERGAISVLMTAATPVRFERVQRDENRSLSADDTAPSYDWDPTLFFE